MFKLPIRQAVLNGNSSVNAYAAADVDFETPIAASAIIAGDQIVINGYGSFTVPAIAAGSVLENVTTGGSGFSAAAVEAKAGAFDITPPTTVVAGEIWDLRLTFSQGPRVLSDIWSYGEKKSFQSRPLTAATAKGWVDAFVAGLANVNPEYFGGENVLEFSNASDKLRVTFKTGYEGIGIKMAQTIDATSTVGPDVMLAVAVVVGSEPSEGVNLGKQIEAEVRNATFTNIDPYGVQFGGSDQGVDVRGKYTEVHWTAAGPLNGFEPHAMTGYGDANTETNHAATEHSVFCNEASAATAAEILGFLAGIDSSPA